MKYIKVKCNRREKFKYQAKQMNSFILKWYFSDKFQFVTRVVKCQGIKML